jgi:hypothetical protein
MLSELLFLSQDEESRMKEKQTGMKDNYRSMDKKHILQNPSIICHNASRAR